MVDIPAVVGVAAIGHSRDTCAYLLLVLAAAVVAVVPVAAAADSMAAVDKWHRPPRRTREV